MGSDISVAEEINLVMGFIQQEIKYIVIRISFLAEIRRSKRN